jgi:oligosaccharyltransferase complex subunit delta (ribophorin II)
VVKVLQSSSSTLKDAFYALIVNGILKCKIGEAGPKVNNCLLSVS